MMRFAWPGFNGFEDRKHYWAYLFARLKTGITLEQAASAINVAYHNIINEVETPLQKMSEQTLARFKARQIELAWGNRGQSDLHTEARIPLILLLGVTGFVLLIAHVWAFDLVVIDYDNFHGDIFTGGLIFDLLIPCAAMDPYSTVGTPREA